MKVIIERLPEIDFSFENISSSILGFGLLALSELLLIEAHFSQTEMFEPSLKLNAVPHFSHIIHLM